MFSCNHLVSMVGLAGPLLELKLITIPEEGWQHRVDVHPEIHSSMGWRTNDPSSNPR